MTVLDRNEIWAQAFELGQLILESPEVAHYKQCEQALEADAALSAKVAKFRELQEQFERLAEHGSGPHLDGLRGDIKTLSDELNARPEIQAYKAAMKQVDELLKSVTDTIAQTIAENNG